MSDGGISRTIVECKFLGVPPFVLGVDGISRTIVECKFDWFGGADLSKMV